MSESEIEYNDGWIKLHRKSLRSSVFDDPLTWKIWTWCLMRSAHKPHEFIHGAQVVTVKEGQFITGRKVAKKELRTTEQKYRTRIAILEKTGRISVKSTNKYSLITVLNWDKYQSKDEKVTNKQPTNNQQITTNKNVKKGKERKEVLSEKSLNIKSKQKNDMAWNKYNENKHSDDLPAIDMDSGEEIETEEDELKKQNKKVTELIEWGAKLRGKPFMSVPTQRKKILEMKSSGYNPTQIKDTFIDLLNSDYWKEQDRLPDFKTVHSSLSNKK